MGYKLKFSFILIFSISALSFTPDLLGQGFGKKKARSSNSVSEAEYYFFEGEKYFILEDYVKSLALFQKANEVSPDIATINYKIGEVYLKGKDLHNALPYAKRAVALDPQNKYFYLLAAEIHTRLGEFPEAADVFMQMMERIPNTDFYIFDLAALYVYDEAYDKAIAAYNEAEKFFGVSEEISLQKQKIYLKKNQLENAIAEGEKLIENFPGESAYVVALSEILMSNNKGDQAVPYLEELVDGGEANPQAQLLLFEIYRQAGDENKAEESLQQAFENPELGIEAKLPLMVDYIQRLPDLKIEILSKKLAESIVIAHPFDANAYAIYGDLLFALDQKEAAKNKYQQALEQDNTNFAVWQNILDIELGLNQLDEVVAHTDEALEIFPNQASLYYFRGAANMLKKNYKEAVFHLEQGKKLSTSNPDLQTIFLSQLGDAYNSLKNYDKSEQNYEAALAINPNNEYVLNNYSYFLSLRKEKLDLAKKMSARLVKNNPTSATYLDTYAWVLYMLGDYKEALKYLERALQHDPSGVIFEHYGDILFKLGDTDKAVVQWQKAKGLNDTSDLIDKKIADKKLYE